MSDLILLSNNDETSVINKDTTDVSTEVNLNYNKSSLNKDKGITTIHVDRAIKGKGEFANTKTYTQNSVKKFELTGNKEVCLRKILIAERTDQLFDITVREIKVYHRKDKKHKFNKVVKFKTPIGTIEHVFDLLTNPTKHNHLDLKPKYYLN